MKKIFKKELHQIKTFVLDVDGVLTDGSVTIDAHGELLRTMNVKDGYALKLALNKGFQVVVITGGTNQGVKDRLKALGIQDIFLGVHNKAKILKEYFEDYGVDASSALYMGDDLPDLEAMKMCHLAACPTDAAPEIRSIADYVSPMAGGKGCVRDVVEQTLKIHKQWNHDETAIGT